MGEIDLVNVPLVHNKRIDSELNSGGRALAGLGHPDFLVRDLCADLTGPRNREVFILKLDPKVRGALSRELDGSLGETRRSQPTASGRGDPERWSLVSFYSEAGSQSSSTIMQVSTVSTPRISTMPALQNNGEGSLVGPGLRPLFESAPYRSSRSEAG